MCIVGRMRLEIFLRVPRGLLSTGLSFWPNFDEIRESSSSFWSVLNAGELPSAGNRSRCRKRARTFAALTLPLPYTHYCEFTVQDRTRINASYSPIFGRFWPIFDPLWFSQMLVESNDFFCRWSMAYCLCIS